MSADTDTAPATVGERIAAARRRAGLSQGDLAACTNYSRSLIRKVEQGRRAATPPLVDAAARALGVSIDELVEDPQ